MNKDEMMAVSRIRLDALRNARPRKPKKTKEPEVDLTAVVPVDPIVGKQLWLARNEAAIRIDETKSAQEILIEGAKKVAALYNALVDSITEDDLNDLTTRDKIAAIQKLGHIHEVVKNTKSPSSVKFQQININSASKEELEALLMDTAMEE